MGILDNNGIKYYFELSDNYDIDDEIKITIFTDGHIKIGHLIYTETNFYGSYDEEDNQEIINLVNEYEPMSLDYLWIEKKFREYGFANILMDYFIKNIVKDKICILLVCGYGYDDRSICKYYDSVILPKFYEKYGFVKLSNSQYMVKNLY